MHSQKIANLSDLIMALMDLLQLDAKTFESITEKPNRYLVALTQKTDLLPNLQLYIFHLRHHITSS